jgi:hypothetical protein
MDCWAVRWATSSGRQLSACRASSFSLRSPGLRSVETVRGGQGGNRSTPSNCPVNGTRRRGHCKRTAGKGRVFRVASVQRLDCARSECSPERVAIRNTHQGRAWTPFFPRSALVSREQQPGLYAPVVKKGGRQEGNLSRNMLRRELTITHRSSASRAFSRSLLRSMRSLDARAFSTRET